MSEQTSSFVRTDMLPAMEPPSSQVGAAKWARENLFGGWVSTVLTLLSITVIVYVVWHLFPWFANGVWNAGSLTQCREILDGATGACWAVIRVNWLQLVFGFYPPELYWRPILAFVLLFVAIAPVLFPSVPRKLLWFSLLYPFVAVWLLWGGTIWGPVLTLAGFALGYGVLLAAGALGTVIAAALTIAVPVLFWLFAMGPLADTLHAILPLEIESVASRDFGGFMISVVIGVAGIALSLPLGILFALGRQSTMPIIKWISVVFIEFIRGVPLITLLFTASLLLNYFLPPGTNFDLILRVIIMVTLFATAYMAEVIRGGLAALPKGQYEAADALGLDYWKAQRLIIMPQALKISIPGIVSSFIGLFKDTTLVIFVGLLDPLKGITDAVRASIEWKGAYWEPYLFVGAIFWIICFSMSRYSMYLERLLKREHR